MDDNEMIIDSDSSSDEDDPSESLQVPLTVYDGGDQQRAQEDEGDDGDAADRGDTRGEEQSIATQEPPAVTGLANVEDGETGQEQRQEQKQGDAKETVPYLKKLLGVAKRSIEDLKTKYNERCEMVKRQDKIISELRHRQEKVVNLAKRAQKRIGELEQELKNARQGTGMQNEEEAEAPIAVLLRIRNVESNVVWCLCRMESGSTEWIDEEDAFVRAETELTLPGLALSESESKSIMETSQRLEKELQDVSDKFRKYRVRMEIVRKQKEAEVERLMTNNLKYKQHNILSQDYHSQLEYSRKEIDRLTQLQMESEKELATLKTDKQNLLKSIKQYKKEIGQLTEQQKKAEETEKQEAESRILAPQALSLQNAALIEQYAKLEREYDKYREHVIKMFEEKDARVTELERLLSERDLDGENMPDDKSWAKHNDSMSVHSSVSGTSSATGGGASNSHHRQQQQRLSHKRSSSSRMLKELQQQVGLEKAYIKNILLKYMAAEDSEKETIEAALATALQFTQDEVRFVQEKRQSSLRAAASAVTSSWFRFSS